MENYGDYKLDGNKRMLDALAQVEAHIAQRSWSLAKERWASLMALHVEVPIDIICRYADAYAQAHDFDSAREVVRLHLTTRAGKTAARRQLSLIDSAEAKKYTLKVTRTNKNNTFKIDDILGRPSARIADLRECSIRGWAKLPEGKTAFLLVETPTDRSLLAFNKVRLDVQGYFLRRDQPVSANCGFIHKIDVRQGARLGIVVDDQVAYEVEICLEQAADVLEGKDGWLFLANDSNRSREQFTGEIGLTAVDQEAWTNFSQDLARLQIIPRTAFLIANSKERVVPERYPFPESCESIADHVSRILTAAKVRCVDPKCALKRNPNSFYRTDTHWSDLGAYIACQETLCALGYQNSGIPGITFLEDDAIGDLGSKLSPPILSKRLRHVYKPPSEIRRVFDNALTTTGRVQIFLNDQPRHDQTAMLFGGSSLAAGAFYRYFAYQFRRVVMVNMPGSIIMSMIEYEQPSAVVIQTNERYLRTPGRIYPDIRQTSIPRGVQSVASIKKIAMLAAIENSEELFYKRMFLELF